MMTPRQLFRRLRDLVRGRKLGHDLDDEIAFHVDMDAASRVASGEPPAVARARAARAIGGERQVKERMEDARGIGTFRDFLQDARIGMRTMLRRPAFALATLLTFAIGVGGTSAIMGAVHGILLAPLPYPDADRLLFVWETDPKAGIPRVEPAPANFLDWRERQQTLSGLASLEPYGLDWMSPDGPEYMNTWLVSEGFFDVLGVQAYLGRTLQDADYVPGGGKVVVLGHSMWRTLFGGDPGVVGRSHIMDGESWQVVGVMPPEFDLGGRDWAWAPKIWAGWEKQARTSYFYTVIGRLRDGVTFEQAGEDFNRIAAQLQTEYPTTNTDQGVELVQFPEQLLGTAREALLLLLGAVGLVLLVAVANIAGLQLARVLDRSRELTVRRALGAGRGRLARHLLAENLALALLGSGLGLLLAYGLLGVLRQTAPPELPRPEQLRGSGAVLLAALGAALLASLAAGVFPAVVATRRQASGTDAGSRSTTPGRRARRLRAFLVTAQVAVALVLLVGAGLLLRSFVALTSEDRGFRTDNILVAVAQGWTYFPTAQERQSFGHEAIRSLRETPGVEAAGLTTAIPLGPSIAAEHTQVRVQGQPFDPQNLPMVQYAVADGGYFDVLGVPLISGRVFTDADRADTRRVAVVNEAYARRFLAGEDPIGKSLVIGQSRGNAPDVPVEIIGVAGNVRRFALSDVAQPTVYIAQSQSGSAAFGFLVRTTGAPEAMVEQVKHVLWQFNASMPISNVNTIERLVGESLRERRFLLSLIAAFAVMALALAATGLFGLMSQATSERTREIGVRIAFGADRGRVVGRILLDGGRLALIGAAVGLVVAGIASRALANRLYGIGRFDAVTFVAGAAALLLVALVASWAPARRAAAVDPVEALRGDG